MAAPPPQTVEEALAWLDRVFYASREDIAYLSPVALHHSLGQVVRNDLGLWHGSPLAQHFKAMGVLHPDDMSMYLLDAYLLWLHEGPHPLPSAPEYTPPTVKTAYTRMEIF